MAVPINELVLPHYFSKFIEAIQLGNSAMIKSQSTIIIGLYLLLQVVSVVFDLADAEMTPKFQGFMAIKMIRQLLDKYDQNYRDVATGSTVARFSKIPELFSAWLTTFKDYLIVYFITFIGTIIYFWQKDPVLGAAFAFILIMMLTCVVQSFSFCQNVADINTSSQSNFQNEMEDVMVNFVSIFSSDRKSAEIDRLESVKQIFEKNYKSTVMCGLKLKSMFFAILMVFFVFFMKRITHLVETKKIKASDCVALIMMFTGIANNLIWCVDLVRDIIKDWSVVSDTELFLQKLPVTYDPTLLPLFETTGRSLTGLGFWNVNFSYEDRPQKILEDANFHIDQGERVIITGENGMGKTTLMKILLQFYCPVSGGVYINGKWIYQYSASDLRKLIGYIPQNTILFDRTILENIMYGNEDKTEEEARTFVANSGISTEFPDLGKKVGRFGNQLSGGQRQLVWMLRILLKNPPYIILDEPTNSLDSHTKTLLVSLLDKISPEQTVIAISHDPDFIVNFTRNIVVHKGQIQ